VPNDPSRPPDAAADKSPTPACSDFQPLLTPSIRDAAAGQSDRQHWFFTGRERLTAALRGSKDLFDLCRDVIECLGDQVDAVAGAIYLYDACGRLWLTGGYSLGPDYVKLYAVGPGKFPVGEAVVTGAVHVITRPTAAQTDLRWGPEERLPTNVIVIPLGEPGDVQGEIQLGRNSAPTIEQTQFLADSVDSIVMALRAARSNRRAAEIEARLRAVVDHAAVAIVTFDSSGRIESFNPGAERMFDYSTLEVLGQDIKLLVPKLTCDTDDAATIDDFESSGLSGVDYNLPARRKDGREFPAHVTLSTVQFNSRRHYSAIIRDVTQTNSAGNSLADHSLESQLLHRVTMIASEAANAEEALHGSIEVICELTRWPVGHVYVPGDDGTTLFPAPMWSSGSQPFEQFREVTDQTFFAKGAGLPGSVFVAGRAMWIENVQHRVDFLRGRKHVDIRVKAAMAVPIAIGRETVAVLEFFHPDPLPTDGELLSTLELVGKQIGQVLKRRRAEQRVAEAYALKQAVLDAACDVAIIATTYDGMITVFNRGAEKLSGYTAREMIDKQTPLALHLPSEVEECARQVSERFGREVIGWELLVADISPDGAQSRQWTYVRKDGGTRLVNLSVSAITDAQGATTGYLCVAVDVTEQKNAENSLKQATHVAETANRAKSEFLANMSHEIRTPMTAILGYAEYLLNEKGVASASPERVECIRTIQRNGAYLLALINDILDLSKIEAGKLEIERIACSPLRIIPEVIAMLRVRAEAKNLSLTAEFAGPIPETIQSDPTRLRQILFNLVGNAVKFTEAGSVRVVTELIGADRQDPKLQIRVIDTGIGLTQAQIGRLFQPFTQADASTTRKYGGSGLGLTIGKRLAEMLGGTITVDSESGKGSTFCITVDTGPLDGVRLLESPRPPVLSSFTDESPAGNQLTLNCRVLLAEDGPDNQRLISVVLKKAGAQVTLADNGRIAVREILAAAESGAPYDVVLMDMQMPELDGYGATRELRAAGCKMPVIALTAHAMTGDRHKCLAAGCTDYMTKPIDREKLIALVAKYSPRHSKPPAAAHND